MRLSSPSPVVPRPLPLNSQIRTTLPQCDHEEAFAVHCSIAPDTQAQDMVHRLVDRCPPGLKVLFTVKELVLGPLGFQTLHVKHFKSVQTLPDEVIYSFDDPTFRSHISIFLDRNAQQVIFGNRIQFKNRLGKWYFTCIRPLHERVITTLLNRLQEDPDGT